MGWNALRTWLAGEQLTATLFNAQLRDNLAVAVAPAVTRVRYTKGSNYTLTGAGSTSWTDVDATNLAGSITLAARTRIKFTVQFEGSVTLPSGTYGAWRILVDGATAVGDTTHGIGARMTSSAVVEMTFVDYIEGLSAGAHTFKLQWVSDNTAATLTMLGSIPIRIIAEEF